MKTGKTLTAFFSLSGETYVNGHIEVREKGNTMVVAERLAAMIETDLFHIRTVEPYPFAYRDVVDIAKNEWKNDARPAIAGKVEGMDRYDTVILGYPNWCNTMPKAVCTFLESYDFRGKRIVPYCTNEGSGLGDSVRDIRKLCPGAEVTDGTPIHGADAATVTAELEAILTQI